MKRFTALLLLSISVFVLAGCVFFAKGTVTGTVTDDLTGDSIAEALVTVGKESVKTDTQGEYTLTVKPGTYDMTVQKTGYATATEQITVTKDQTTAQDVQLASTEVGMVEGYVTDTKGGPVVAGVNVTCADNTAVTDENGYFSFMLNVAEEHDIIFEKNGLGSVKLQDVVVVPNEIQTFDIQMRTTFNPNWSLVPPTVEVTNITAGQELQGEVTFNLSISGDNNTSIYYVWMNSETRNPRNSVAFDVNEGKVTLNTALYPNGEGFIKIHAFDTNENSVMMYIPIVVNNAATATELPSAIPYIELCATTYGDNFGYYKNGHEANVLSLPNGRTVDLNSFTEDATIFNQLWWVGAEGADGYTVYRSFDEINWVNIGDTNIMMMNPDYKELMYRYDDFSSALAPNQRTYYKVVPYNSFGQGETASFVDVTPLVPQTVTLKTPANEAVNVALAPTFTWERDVRGELPVGAFSIDYLSLYDATEYVVAGTRIIEDTSYEYEGVLEPGCVYSWDIYGSLIACEYIDEDTRYSYAISYAGGQTVGAENGEFVFTTTTELGE